MGGPERSIFLMQVWHLETPLDAVTQFKQKRPPHDLQFAFLPMTANLVVHERHASPVV